MSRCFVSHSAVPSADFHLFSWLRSINSLTSVFATSAACWGSGDSYSTSSRPELPEVRTVRLRCTCWTNSSLSGRRVLLENVKMFRTRDANARHPVADSSLWSLSFSITCSSRDSLCRSLTCVSIYDSGMT